MSICKIRQFRPKVPVSQVTRSEKRVPTAISRSQSRMQQEAVLVPCIPSIPTYRWFNSSNPPWHISEQETGASTFSANARSSSEASELMTPPPA